MNTKIYPISWNPTTWKNYSNYLNWIYETIESWDHYLKYFSPNYEILNESMSVFNTIKEKEETTQAIIDPAWKYTITSVVNGTTTSKVVYCYFPSELQYRQGYWNTHSDSYICYFAPPDAYSEKVTNTIENGEIVWNRHKTITKEKWDDYVEAGKIDIFPKTRVIISNQWRHVGIQHPGNYQGFMKNNYLIIAKPSAVWYTISSGYKKLSFQYEKNAMEQIGAYVPFALDFSPRRYVLDSSRSMWEKSQKNIQIPAALWDSNSSTDGTPLIFTEKKQMWMGSYPIMHSLTLKETGEDGEYVLNEFVTDDVFYIEKKNIDNHATAVYNINTSNKKDDIKNIWDQIFILIC